MGGGAPANTTQTVIQQQQLPAWYQSYLQNLIGRAQGEAAGEAPVYGGPRVAGMNDVQNQALSQIQQGRDFGRPEQWAAFNAYQGIGQNNPLTAAQGSFDQGTQYAANAAGTDISGGINPYVQGAAGLASQGAGQNVLGTASPYIQQAVGSPQGLMAAAPFLGEANQDIGQATQSALSPYLGGALNSLSDQAAYDLKNKYLPSVQNDFIKAGQFGSSRQQDITAQTINDLSRNVMDQQAQMINSAYGQAGNVAQANLGLKGQLGQIAGGLGSQNQQALLQAGQGLGTLAGTQGQLQIQGAGQYGNLAGTVGNALSQEGQLNLGAANAMNNQGMGIGQLANAYNNTQLGVGQGQTALANQVQNNLLNYNNALYAAGSAQQGQQQKSLDTAYQDWQNQTFYPQNQTSWLSNIVRGLPSQPAGYGQSTTTQVPSNTGAQVAGLLGAGAGLAGQGQGAGGSIGGYFRRGGKVKKYAGGGKVRGGLGQFSGAA